MFQHIVSTAWRIDRGCSRMSAHAKPDFDTTTKFMVVVTSLFNLVISSFPDNMYSTNMAVDLSWWFQQRCSSLFVHQATNSLFQHAWTSLSTTLFKLASSTMFKPVNNAVQVGQLNHVQACQQHCSSWPAQPCSRLSTTMSKLASLTMFKPVNNHVQAGQLNHVQACQQAKSKLCVFTCVK